MEISNDSEIPNRPQQFAHFLPIPLTRNDLRRNFAAAFNRAALSCPNRLKTKDLRQERRIDSAELDVHSCARPLSRVPLGASASATVECPVILSYAKDLVCVAGQRPRVYPRCGRSQPPAGPCRSRLAQNCLNCQRTTGCGEAEEILVF